MMKILATTSLPAVDRPNADRWNAARSCQNVRILYRDTDFLQLCTILSKMCAAPYLFWFLYFFSLLCNRAACLLFWMEDSVLESESCKRSEAATNTQSLQGNCARGFTFNYSNYCNICQDLLLHKMWHTQLLFRMWHDSLFYHMWHNQLLHQLR